MTPSEPVNYELAAKQIADVVVASFNDAPAEHDSCLFRLTDEDRQSLDLQRIAQLAQDALGYEIEWRIVSREEAALNHGTDIGTDCVLVLKRQVSKEDTNG